MSKWVDGKKTRGRRAKVAGTRVIADGKFRPSGNIVHAILARFVR